jgi:hypothetical protein
MEQCGLHVDCDCRRARSLLADGWSGVAIEQPKTLTEVEQRNQKSPHDWVGSSTYTCANLMHRDGRAPS